MAIENRHPDENTNPEPDERLSADLKVLFAPRGAVPPEVDRAIMDRASKRLVGRSRRLAVRWVASAAAAAAVIILVFTLNTSDKRASTQMAEKFEASKTSPVMRGLAAADLTPDIDRSGRVDILDAFKLARQIKAGLEPDKKWDMNGDGLVNRKDVDLVAFAAVRLDKGVL